jgi:hypothetical protein
MDFSRRFWTVNKLQKWLIKQLFLHTTLTPTVILIQIMHQCKKNFFLVNWPTYPDIHLLRIEHQFWLVGEAVGRLRGGFSSATRKHDKLQTESVLPGGRRHGHFPQMWQCLKAEWP